MHTQLNTIGLIAALAAPAGAQLAAEEGASTLEDRFDKLWSYATLYKNEDNSVIQKLAFTGRLQYDLFSFEDDDAGSYDNTKWRRARAGFKAQVFNDFTIHSEMDMDLEYADPVYNRLTDSYIAWHPSDDWKVKVGKQSAGFTLDGSTSSKKLIGIERSKVTGNIWFTAEYFTGVQFSGDKENWSYKAGVFSNDNGEEFDKFGEEKFFTLLSLGYDFADSLDADKALVRLDYVYNDEPDDFDNLGTKKNENTLSLSGQWDKGSYHVWADIAYAEGFNGNDLFGFSVMPFYDISDTFQVVGRYTYITSSEDNGVGLSRYEKDLVSGKGDEVHEFFFGLNTYIYGHKLKWQNGVQYTDMSDDAKDGGEYDGVGFTSAIRLTW